MHTSIFSLVFTYVVLIVNIHGRKISDLQSSDGNSNASLTPMEVIKRHGYPSEAHEVKSQDGYILELHRIPYGKSGPGNEKRIPIFLHHGVLSSSSAWLINGPNKSLGYRLADAGYDVWLANARGNTFSRRHVKFDSKQKEFWNFSFHEMGFYDLPASIDHILKTTEEEQLIYIGYSLGTTVFYAMASTLPKYNKKIKFQISLAPISAIPHTTSSVRLLVPYVNHLDNAIYLYSNGVVLEHDFLDRTLWPFICSGITSTNKNVCKKNFLFRIFRNDPEQFDDSYLPMILNNFPAGTSSKNIIHCSQLISSGTFAQYDYGKTENVKKYGSATPPKYNINKITVPIRLYYGENDVLSTPLDAKILYQKIFKPLGLKRVNFDKFGHAEFLSAKDINTLLNDEIIEFINNSTHQNGSSDFVRDTILQARDIRRNTPAPVDVPFDEKSFLIKTGKEFLGNIINDISNAVGNAASDNVEKVQTTVEKMRIYVNNILDKIKRKAKDLKEYIT